ncbi:MAG: enoyl-CoA hydratase [Gammaproteobacteria bacterium]|jgi:enoyl-CoA hydratase|nr:enoyl-CoA hydratase [Gammaproteobacteria bacterium]MBT4492294.1 enoyl-CoA hydratase [Gammaproteobacteria bacterium]MBT7369435.1 enoyl-CoA hydratase [Gammaproteobacteria bacterium]
MELKTDKMLAHVDNGIGWITFNNPARRNAISLEMWDGLATSLESFQHDDEVRVVVMLGAGDQAFVSGADISEFDTKRGTAAQKETYGKTMSAANRWLTRMDKPMIAMIQGYCIGGGLATALSADLRFATPDSTFGIPAARLGLGYEYEGLVRLCHLVGPARAKDIMFSARYMGADEALAMGLINRICEVDKIEQEVRDYAAIVAANAPLTVKAAKAAINEAALDPEHRNMEAVRSMIDACFDSEDYKEGRLAFSEKRKPKFRGA